MPAKSIPYLMALISIAGVALSLYTEFIQGVTPCLACYILRVSFVLMFFLSIACLRFRSASYISAALSLLAIGVASWGVSGLLGYSPSPCIEVCNLGSEIEVSFRLFFLALIGGTVELILSLALIRSRR